MYCCWHCCCTPFHAWHAVQISMTTFTMIPSCECAVRSFEPAALSVHSKDMQACCSHSSIQIHALPAVQVLVTAFTVVPSRSGAVRTFEQRRVLELFNQVCVSFYLYCLIFFGSSVKISDKVMEVTAQFMFVQCTLAQYRDT